MDEREAKRALRDTRRHLRALTAAVRAFLVALDAEMAKPASPERGRRVARLANDLDLANDAALHFGLGEALRPRKKAPRG